MSEYRVTHTRKDDDGDIVALCNRNPGERWEKSIRDVISDIERGSKYYVKVGSAPRVEIYVVNGQSGKYLRTGPDGSGPNNLDDLPSC